MKIKLIALAVAALVSGAANASVNISTSIANSNDMLINIWDSAGSFTKGLSVNFGSLSAAAATAAPGDLLTLDLTSDVAFQAFIAGRTSFNWDIIGVNTVGNYSSISTTNGTGALGTAPLNTAMKTGTTNILNFVSAINSGIATPGATNVTNGIDSLYTSTNPAPTYINSNGGAATGLFISNSAIVGTNANNSFESGLGLLKEVGSATGTSRSTQTYFTGVTAYIDGANVLHIAAVPEPESLAMLLAGLGIVGSIAMRRNRKLA